MQGMKLFLWNFLKNSGSSESVASSARPAADSSGEPVVQNSESNEDASSVKEALKNSAKRIRTGWSYQKYNLIKKTARFFVQAAWTYIYCSIGARYKSKELSIQRFVSWG